MPWIHSVVFLISINVCQQLIQAVTVHQYLRDISWDDIANGLTLKESDPLKHLFHTVCHCVTQAIFLWIFFIIIIIIAFLVYFFFASIYESNDTYLRHIFITHCWTLGAHSDLATNRLLSLDNKLYFSVSWSGAEWKKCKEWCHIICFMWSDLSVISYCAAHVLVHILFLFSNLFCSRRRHRAFAIIFLHFYGFFLCIARISFEKS